MRGKKIVNEISLYITSRIFTNPRQLYPPSVTSGGSRRFNLWQLNPPSSDIWWQWILSGIGDTFVTLKANAKKIVTLKCIRHQICTKSLL